MAKVTVVIDCEGSEDATAMWDAFEELLDKSSVSMNLLYMMEYEDIADA